jgi:hypothetical protein
VHRFSLLGSFFRKNAGLTKLWRYYRYNGVNNAKVSLYPKKWFIANGLRKIMHLITPKLPKRDVRLISGHTLEDQRDEPMDAQFTIVT